MTFLYERQNGLSVSGVTYGAPKSEHGSITQQNKEKPERDSSKANNNTEPPFIPPIKTAYGAGAIYGKGDAKSQRVEGEFVMRPTWPRNAKTRCGPKGAEA